jgi:signal transduction histidine kinase
MDLPTGKMESPADVLDGVSEWVLVLGPDGIVEWSNRSFIEFMGARGPNDTPWDLRLLFPPDEVFDELQEIIRSGKLRSGIIRPVQGMNGERRMIRFTALPRRSAGLNNRGIYLYGLDVTPSIEMENLKKYTVTQIEKNIEQFAVLGDNLRNPVTAIIGLCDLLEDKETATKIQARAQEIDDLITRIDRGWIDSEKIRNIIRKYYDIGAVGVHELVAQAIHEEYIEMQKNVGGTPETNPSIRPWNELPRRLKESNLRQVEDIWKTLYTIHCTIGLSSSTREPLFAFTDREVEFLAEREHVRWVEERIKKGWRFSNVRDYLQKIHECIIPWEQLSEAQREKDRNAVRALPGILAKVNLKIIRLDNSNTDNLIVQNKNPEKDGYLKRPA